MRWLPFLAIFLHPLARGSESESTFHDFGPGPASASGVLQPIYSPLWDLNSRPSVNATGSLIFDSVSSLLQHWPNTRYRNGHTIVPGSVPIGTLLYHGRVDAHIPTVPQWTAADPEHAYIYCREAPKADGCWMLTLTTTRALRILYFDGTSAGKTPEGTMDSQDIIAWPWGEGDEDGDRWVKDVDRLDRLCAWGSNFGVDGFVRMQMDFEIMLCSFTSGLAVSSFHHILSADLQRNFPTPTPDPETHSDWNEVMLAGSWHNRFPGDPRVHLDIASVISLYDPLLVPSLVLHRFGVDRYSHRAGNISRDDTQAVLARLEAVLTKTESGSGIDWRSLIHTITNRFADRLEMVEYLLNSAKEDKAERVQSQLRYMLQPYILHDLPITAGISWAEPIYASCATSHVKYAMERWTMMSDSEKALVQAVGETTKEICRVVTRMWAHGVLAGLDDVRPSSDSATMDPLDGWTHNIHELKAWLDWSVWIKCEPECGFEEFCYLPTWPMWYFPPMRNEDWRRPTPRCVSKTHPFKPY